MEEKVKINWSFSALSMLAELHEYLKAYSEQSAEKYIDGIFEYTKRLEKYPEMCASCRHSQLSNKGYRCCTYRNHIIIYSYNGKLVDILAVIHAQRNPENIDDLLEN